MRPKAAWSHVGCRRLASLAAALVLWAGPAETTDARPSGQAACACADGRTFAVRGSVFGPNSSRVVITDIPGVDTDSTGTPPVCTDLHVVAQDIKLSRDSRRRPYRYASIASAASSETSVAVGSGSSRFQGPLISTTTISR